MKEKVVGYIRVSSAQQVEGFSLTAQAEAIRSYCDKNEFELIEIIEDAGISGATIDKRLGLISMLQAIKKDPSIKKVIVWKLSRLGRNTLDLLNIQKELKEFDVSIISITENINTSNAMGEFFYNMTGIFAELERDNISAQAYLGMRQNAIAGYYGGGKPPLGYDKAPKGPLTINENEAKTVRLIFDLYTNQNKGYAIICKVLNNNLQSYATKNGKPWSHATLKQVLDNPIYVGKIRWGVHRDWNKKRRSGRTNNPIIAEGHHEPVIDQSLWDRTVTKRKTTGIRPEKKVETMHLLSGLPKCPACGSGMYSHRTQKKLPDGTKKYFRYYACGAWKNKHTCKANLVDATVLESEIIARLINFITTADLKEKIIKSLGDNNNIENLQTILKDSNQLLNKKKKEEDSYYRYLVDPEVLKKLPDHKIMDYISEVSNDIQNLTHRIMEVEDEIRAVQNANSNAEFVADSLNNFEEIFQNAPFELKKDLIRILIDEIIILDGKGPQDRKVKEIKLSFNLSDINHGHIDNTSSKVVAIYDTAHFS